VVDDDELALDLSAPRCPIAFRESSSGSASFRESVERPETPSPREVKVNWTPVNVEPPPALRKFLGGSNRR
jgi:hypothetical protein